MLEGRRSGGFPALTGCGWIACIWANASEESKEVKGQKKQRYLCLGGDDTDLGVCVTLDVGLGEECIEIKSKGTDVE